MAMIHTAYGPGEVVAQETVRGRTQYQVAGNGFKVWLDEVEVNKRTASDPRDRQQNHTYSESRDRGWDEHGQQDLDDYDQNWDAATGGYGDEDPWADDPHRHWISGAASFDFEPSDHVNEDNSTTLPYTWQPQYPIDMFRHEQTMSPDHEIDLKKRMKPSDSRSGESREEIHPYPGPNPDLFAEKEGRLGWTFHDEDSEPEEDRWHQYNTHAVSPQELEGPHHGRDLEVVGNRPAGLSDKYIEIHEAADHYNDPIVRFRDDPVREIHRHGSIDVSAGLDHETGEWMSLVEADKQIRTAAWSDVRQKAMRLRREGRVAVQDMDHNRIYANVKGDHGEYDVMILKGGAYGGAGGGQSITDWRCSCDWGKWAFKRQLTYVGRLCSHGYATYLTQQAAYLKDNPHHFKKRKASRKLAGVDAFKSWADKENGGHIDLDAADNYLSTLDEPCSKEDAQKILEYVQTHHSERPERNYDVKGYTYDEDKVYKNADALRHQPGKLTPHTYVVPEGEEQHFEDLGDDRETTGPDQIMAAKGESTSHHPDFAWHVSDEPDFPEQGIVHFSNRHLALSFTADEGLLNKLRDLSQDAYKPGDMQDRNREISETVKELRDRGYDADQLVASVRRTADARDDENAANTYMGLPQGSGSGPEPLPSAGGMDRGQLFPGPSGAPTPSTAPLPGGGSMMDFDSTGGLGAPKGPAGINRTSLPSGGTAAPVAAPGVVNGPNASIPWEDTGTQAAPKAVGDRPTSTPAAAGGAASAVDVSNKGGGDKIGPGNYTVQQGDTLSGIADRAGDKGGYQDLVKGNPGSVGNSGTDLAKNPDLIHPGDSIKIPGVPAPAAPAAGNDNGPHGAPGSAMNPTSAVPGPSVSGAPPGGNITPPTTGIHAQRFAELYFQADDDEKKLNSPENTNPALNDPSATTVTPNSVNMPDTGPGNHPQPNQGPAYPQISGPGAPAGTPGSQPVNSPRSTTNAFGQPMPTAPLHSPENNAPTEGASAENAAATPGTKTVGPNPGAGGGGGMGGLQDAMNIAGPLIGEIGSGIGGLLGGGLGGLTHLFGSNDPQKFAAQYMQGAGDFLTKGGPDWMDYPFAGSGPDRQDWSTTSEDYVDEHERPKRQETWRTDNDGDIVKYTDRLTQPKQSARTASEQCEYCGGHGHDHTAHPEALADMRDWDRERARQEFPFGDHHEARRHADMLSGDAGYGGGPGPEVGGGMVTTPSGSGGFNAAESAGPSGATMGTLSNTAALSESSLRFWGDAVDKSDQGYYNPHNRPYQEYDKGEHGVGDEGNQDDQQNGQQQHGHGGGGQGMFGDALGGEAEAAGGAGAAEELAPLLLAASRDDGSDIVRQFQASGGGCLDGDAPKGGGGQYSDDAIAGQAQRLLRTAGRNYTLAEQRELEDEFHPRGARNLRDLDLTGTHYVD